MFCFPFTSFSCWFSKKSAPPYPFFKKFHLLFRKRAKGGGIHHQHLKFASAISKCRGFCRDISIFFSICLGKKNAEAIKCLIRILKKHVAKNKIYFCFKKKRNVLLNKKVIFVSHTIFNIYCIIHRRLYSLFILLSFSYIIF